MTIKITSTNRGPAKKLLTFCGTDSRLVRTMTLAELGDALQRAVNQGLITQAQINRLLGRENDEWRNDDDSRRGNGKATEKYEDNDDEENKQNGERGSSNGSDSGQESESEDKSESSGDSKSDGESKSESESNDGSGDGNDGDEREDGKDSDSGDDDESGDGDENNGDGDGDRESEDESDSEEKSESESENDSEGESEEQENEESNEDDDGNMRHDVFPRVLKYIRAGLNVALVGPAGTGKSYIARQVASELDRSFFVNGAMMSKYDLIGYCDAHGTYHSTPAHDAFKHGGVHCFDELDASAPDAVVAFNGMTDDQPFYTFPCGQVEQHPEYVAIACMNTWGNGATADYVGRYKQDAASMSRFVRVFVDYDRKIEAKIAGKHVDILHRVWALREACNVLGIRHVVSTRMIVQACKAREHGKATKVEIDADILFAGLDDAAVKQVKPRVNAIQKELAAGYNPESNGASNND